MYIGDKFVGGLVQGGPGGELFMANFMSGQQTKKPRKSHRTN